MQALPTIAKATAAGDFWYNHNRGKKEIEVIRPKLHSVENTSLS